MMEGEERVLTGYLIESTNFGRSLVVDVELQGNRDNALRQVDHRSIEWIIIGGIRYCFGKNPTQPPVPNFQLNVAALDKLRPGAWFCDSGTFSLVDIHGDSATLTDLGQRNVKQMVPLSDVPNG